MLKQKIKRDTAPLSVGLTPEEFEAAETLWVKESQQLLVSDARFPHWKRQFDLFLDYAEVWRCGGRLSNADVPYSTKHPILLPKDHPLTVLIVLSQSPQKCPAQRSEGNINRATYPVLDHQGPVSCQEGDSSVCNLPQIRRTAMHSTSTTSTPPV